MQTPTFFIIQTSAASIDYWFIAELRMLPRASLHKAVLSSAPDAASDIQGSAAEEPPVNINLDTAEIEYKQQ